MRKFNVVIERDFDTGYYVASVPGFPGAHAQGDTVDDALGNLQEVVAMLLEDGNPTLEGEFVGVRQLEVA